MAHSRTAKPLGGTAFGTPWQPWEDHDGTYWYNTKTNEFEWDEPPEVKQAKMTEMMAMMKTYEAAMEKRFDQFKEDMQRHKPSGTKGAKAPTKAQSTKEGATHQQRGQRTDMGAPLTARGQDTDAKQGKGAATGAGRVTETRKTLKKTVMEQAREPKEIWEAAVDKAITELQSELNTDPEKYLQTADKVATVLMINDAERRAIGIYEYKVQKIKYREARKAKRHSAKKKKDSQVCKLGGSEVKN